MACYSCGSGFGMLKKEIGCETCGFSFCSRCCKKREIPNKVGENVKQYICNRCYDGQLNSELKQQKNTGSPPLAHKKRMEALKKQSMSVDSGHDVPCAQAWTDERDLDIALRLQKLKRDRVKEIVPSEDDIAERLAKLKGMDPSAYKVPPIEIYRPLKSQSSVDEASSLIKQFTEEVSIDAQAATPVDDIVARLTNLRQRGSEKSEKEEMDIDKTSEQLQEECKSLSDVASSEVKNLMGDPKYKELMLEIQKDDAINSDEEETNKLVEKLMATSISADKLESLDDDSEEFSLKSEKDTEEFPWCVICTENAIIRCFGCDGDLYCTRCFKECHDSLEITDHKTCPYLIPKQLAT